MTDKASISHQARPKVSVWSYLRATYCSGAMVCAGIFLLVAIIALDIALDLQIRRAHDPLGGRFFPVMISSMLALAAAAILLMPIVKTVALGRFDDGADDTEPSEKSALLSTSPNILERPNVRVAAMMLICFGYVASLGLLGFIPSTAAALSATLYVLGARGYRSLVVASAVTTLAVYGVFTYLLLVRLP